MSRNEFIHRLKETKLTPNQRKMAMILFQINGYENAIEFVEFFKNELAKKQMDLEL